jgi:hypothetical protein
MSLIISLDALGVCFVGITMIVLARVLVSVAPSYCWRRSLTTFALAAFASRNRSDVNFY